MQPVSSANSQGTGPASGQDAQSLQSKLRGLFSGRKKVSCPAHPPPSSQADSRPAFDSGPNNAPTLEKRTIGAQLSEKRAASNSLNKIDLTLFRKKLGYDFFAAELPKLNLDSLVQKGACGRTFECRTHSWADTELSLAFTGCDLRGSPKPVNEIGVQSLDAYPSDWDYTRKLPTLQESFDSHFRSIASYVKQQHLSLQFSESEPSEHVLMLGALDEDTTFSMELKVRPWFFDGLQVPPGVTPRELLAFVTTDNLEQRCWFSRFSWTPAHSVIRISDYEQCTVLQGKNYQDELVNQFDTQARPQDDPRPEIKTESPPNELPLRSDYRNAVRVLVTPAVVFNAPPVAKPITAKEDVFNKAEAVITPGLGLVMLKTVPATGNLRLLPCIAVDVVTTDPLAGMSYTPPPAIRPTGRHNASPPRAF